MPTFSIHAEFDLASEVEPDVNSSSFDNGNVDYDEYEDNSYFQTCPVTSSGGDLTFKVEAEDEDEATEKAAQVIFDGQEYEDHNGLTWLVESVSIEVEEVEAEMDATTAKLLVTTWLNALAADGKVEARVLEAFRFLLDRIVI